MALILILALIWQQDKGVGAILSAELAAVAENARLVDDDGRGGHADREEVRRLAVRIDEDGYGEHLFPGEVFDLFGGVGGAGVDSHYGRLVLEVSRQLLEAGIHHAATMAEGASEGQAYDARVGPLL